MATLTALTRSESETYVETILASHPLAKSKLEVDRLGWARLTRRKYYVDGKLAASIVANHNTKLRKVSGYTIYIADSLLAL